jgi:hypothetical protein
MSEHNEIRKLMLADVSSTSKTRKNWLIHNVRESVKGKSICWTSKGYFGLVQGTALVDDVVCLVLGPSVPLILRPKENYLGHIYQLIGPAYFHGIMDG